MDTPVTHKENDPCTPVDSVETPAEAIEEPKAESVTETPAEEPAAAIPADTQADSTASEPAPVGFTAEELAEAERRAYLKGRNEAIADALNGPGLWQLAPDDGEDADSLPEVPILKALRPSIWDL